MSRILVIKLGALGDFVLAFAPFAAIRAQHPTAEITLLTTPPFAEFARAAPWFDRVVTDTRPRLWELPALLRLRRALHGFDRVYDLQTSNRSGWYFRLAGRPDWSGIARGCSRPHANPIRNHMHTLERQRDQLEMAGVTQFPALDLAWLRPSPNSKPSPAGGRGQGEGGPAAEMPPGDRSSSDGRRHPHPSPLPPAGEGDFVVLIPGAAPHRPRKRWPAERFGELARTIAARGQIPLIVGAPADAPHAAAIRTACPAAIDLTGRTTLLQLGQTLAGAAFAVGNDTGPTHLAAALGIPTIALFSDDSDPALTRPRGDVTVLAAPDLADLPVAWVAAALPQVHSQPLNLWKHSDMPAITLPDGSVRRFDGPVTGTAVAADIGPGLARAAVAMKLDGQLVDLSREIDADASVMFVTRKDPDALGMIRHDTAHVLAEAVQSLYPGTQVTIGPSIENGFYYDFARNEPFTPEEFPAIEARMREIVARNAAFEREVWDRDEAIAFFEARGERYKAELIRDLPGTETITLYKQGDWIDLCRGPHMRGTGDVGTAFKLQKVAGAYWRGDHRNPMLTRIYGTAWRDQRELDAYLLQLEEAERRDHRRLGREMDLFHIQEEAAGSIFWHPKGWRLYRTAESYMRRRLDEAGYVEVKTPQLVDRVLWERSGHWDKYREHMFVAQVEDEKRTLALKPMNCPCHVQIFNHGLRSYRELPLRMAEFGACHRYEPSGALHGIMRVRGFTQDDAHIFCTPEQIAPETARFVALLASVYRDFGFDSFRVKFADRPDERAGDDATWDQAEAALREACALAGVEYEFNPGEGAFYGPKLEFVLRDAIGRDWQCGTLQVDYVLPDRLGASYIAEDSSRQRPAMLHRAILGSFERFLGILIEQYAGRFPLWLAPVQLVVASIVTDAEPYAEEVAEAFRQRGLSVVTDGRNEKINAKIREHSLQHVPIIAVVGRKEAEARTVAIRRLGGQAQQVLSLAEALDGLALEAMPPDIVRSIQPAAKNT